MRLLGNARMSSDEGKPIESPVDHEDRLIEAAFRQESDQGEELPSVGCPKEEADAACNPPCDHLSDSTRE